MHIDILNVTSKMFLLDDPKLNLPSFFSSNYETSIKSLISTIVIYNLVKANEHNKKDLITLS